LWDRSSPEFEQVKEALVCGMFLSVQEFEQKKTSHLTTVETVTKDGYDQYCAAIITQKVPRNGCIIDRTGNCPIVLFHGVGDEEELMIVPFGSTGAYKGYVTKESEDDITCIIPLCTAFNYSMMEGFSDDSWKLRITSLWSRAQENALVSEGVALADGILPESLHQTLMQQIDDLADGTDADYHPHSNGIVRDSVHPALYPFVN